MTDLAMGSVRSFPMLGVGHHDGMGRPGRVHRRPELAAPPDCGALAERRFEPSLLTATVTVCSGLRADALAEWLRLSRWNGQQPGHGHGRACVISAFSPPALSQARPVCRASRYAHHLARDASKLFRPNQNTDR